MMIRGALLAGLVWIGGGCATVGRGPMTLPGPMAAANFTETTRPPVAASELAATAETEKSQLPYGHALEALGDDKLRSKVRKLLRALASRPGDTELRVRLGRVLLAAGHAELAIQPLKDAFLLRPGQAAIAALLTEAYVEAGEGEAARVLAKRLVSEESVDPPRWVFLAEVHRRLGDLAASRQAASRALLLAPDNTPARAVIAFGYADEGRRALAWRLLSDIREAPEAPRDAIEHRLAQIAIAEERWESALKHLDAAIGRRADFAAALNDRGVVNARLHRLQEAEVDFLAAIEAAPVLLEAQLNLANLLIDQDLAAAAAQRMAAISPGEVDPPAYEIAAGRLYALEASTVTGRRKALEHLERARELVGTEKRREVERALATLRSLPPPRPEGAESQAVAAPAPAENSAAEVEAATVPAPPALTPPAAFVPVPSVAPEPKPADTEVTGQSAEPGGEPPVEDSLNRYRPAVD